MSDSDRKGPGELDCVLRDLFVESIAFGGRLAPDEQQSVTFFASAPIASAPGCSTRVAISAGSPLGSSGPASSPSSALCLTTALVRSACLESRGQEVTVAVNDVV